MCAALANVEEDNWEWHTFDTVKGGDYLVDQDAAEIMCKEAIDAVLDLEKMGLPFNRTPEGRIDQRRFGGHTRNHGEAAVRRVVLRRRPHRPHDPADAVPAVRQAGRRVLQRVLRARPADEHRRRRRRACAGVVAYELATGEIHVFQAKSVVFATGGFGKVFKTTSNAHTLTGDGMGVVWRRGLPLEDMEFYQFHPTGLAGLGILLTEAARGEGGILRNGEGERFMERYAPTIKDLAPRDMVAAVDVQRGPRGPRRRSEQGLRAARPHPPRAGADRRQAARHHRVRPHLPRRRARTPSRCRSTRPRTTRWAASRPTSTTEVLRDNTRRRPRPVRRRRGRLRVGARLQPAGHQLAARHQRVRPARRHRRRRVRRERRTSSTCPTTPTRSSTAWSSGIRDRRRRRARRRDPQASCRRRWTSTPRSTAPRRTLKQALVDIARAQGALRSTSPCRTRASGTTPTCSRPSSSASCSTWPRSSSVGALARNESRGGHFREDYPTRDDVNFMRHTMAYRDGRTADADQPRGPARLQARDRQTRYQPMERKY